LSQVRVDLRGREVAVPEQHLHHAQLGAMFEQMGGEGVAQVRGESSLAMPPLRA
jgi:hypothetical protein